MQLGFRLTAVSLALSLLLGPLAAAAPAQQPTPPPPAAPASASPDAYDVGAGFANVLVVPGKAVLCTLSGVTGFVLLAVTFGSAYRAAARAAEQGCAGKWYVTGDDLRPTPGAPID